MEAESGHRFALCTVGVGAYTAVGISAPSCAAAVRAGIPGFAEHPYLYDRQGEPVIVASVPHIDEEVTGTDRFLALAVGPAREALVSINAHRRDIRQISVFVGLPPLRPGCPPDLQQRLAEIFRRDLGVSSVQCIAAGHAAGLMALEGALHSILANQAEFCLVGGVDSYLEANTIQWIEENDQLHGGDNPYGFVPGEAAGFCLVCSQQAAERMHLRVLARVRATTTAREANLIKTDSVCVGKGLTAAFQKVLSDLPSESDKIDRTICDMNGEPYRADEYGFTISRLSQRFVNASDFEAPADCWGDVGAASGPLFLNLVVAAGPRDYAISRHNLLWASSESGERSAAVVEYAPPAQG